MALSVYSRLRTTLSPPKLFQNSNSEPDGEYGADGNTPPVKGGWGSLALREELS